MVLHALQGHFGYLSPETIEWTAGRLGLQPINVLELVTFYPMFRQAAGRDVPPQALPDAELRPRLVPTSCTGTSAPGSAWTLAPTGRRRPPTDSSRSSLSSASPVAAPRP